MTTKVSQIIKTQSYQQWVCDECGNEYSTHQIAVDCSEKHTYRGEFNIDDYFTFGQVVKIEYQRETISRLLVERWNGEREWITSWSAKYYHEKITDPENYR